MFCSYCGKDLVENAKYCSYCGEKVIYPKSYSQELDKSTKETVQTNPVRVLYVNDQGFKRNIVNSENLCRKRPVRVDRIVLEERLKDFRKLRAALEKIPPYMVFTDRTLNDIIDILPTNLLQLSKVGGFGEIKVAKYGLDILKIINKLDMNNLAVK